MTGGLNTNGLSRMLIYEDSLPMSAVYLVSYYFIAGIILTNVVVAVLLERYLDATGRNDENVSDDENGIGARAYAAALVKAIASNECKEVMKLSDDEMARELTEFLKTKFPDAAERLKTGRGQSEYQSRLLRILHRQK